MSVLFPLEVIKEPNELINIISDSNIQNQTKYPTDDFLQFLHYNISNIIDLYLQIDGKHDPSFYINVEHIFESKCDDIKIMMSTDEKILNIIFNFLQYQSKESSCLTRGRFCKLLGQLLLLSDIDYTSHISKFKKQTVFFNNKSELRNCGGILFFILIVNNIHYLSFFDLLFNIIKSHTYSALTFFEENFFTQILLNKLATNNLNSKVSSLYIPITFSGDDSDQNDIIETNISDNKFSDIINNNVFKILLYLTCNLSRSSSLVMPLLRKETILTLLDAAINEEKLHILSAFQLINNLHKQSNQISREAIESINGKLPEICKSILKINSESNKNPNSKLFVKSTDVSIITLFVSIINDIYGVAGESIPEPINYKMKKSVHLSDSLELFNIRQKSTILSQNVSHSQGSYVIENHEEDEEDEYEEEEEIGWMYGETEPQKNEDETENENENEKPMTLNEFQRKRFTPVIDTIDEEPENNQQEAHVQVQVPISNHDSQNEEDDQVQKSREKRKSIPHIPNFSSAAHCHLRKPRHSTSILTASELNKARNKPHSGSNSGRIYTKKADHNLFKNAGIINVSKGFTASSGCGRLSINKFSGSVSNNQIPLLHIPKNEPDKFEFTPTSSSSSSSRYEHLKPEPANGLDQIINEEEGSENRLHQIQQIHQHLQYSYSFSDRHIIHAPESEISPVSKNPATGENLSLMEFANQAPSNPQIDLIFHHRTKSLNSVDSNNNDISIPSDYSFSNDPIEEENISLIDLANSSKDQQQLPPMYNGSFGAPPVCDLYPLLQSTPVFFNSALSPREDERETESSPSLQSFSSRTSANTNPLESLFRTPQKKSDATNSMNSTGSVSYSNSSDHDTTNTNTNTNANVCCDDKFVAPKNKTGKECLTSLNLPNLNLSFNVNNNNNNCGCGDCDGCCDGGNHLDQIEEHSDGVRANKSLGSFSVSSGLNKGTRKSLTSMSSGFSYINNYNSSSLSSLNLNESLGNYSPESSINYHYPNSARATRPSFLPTGCFTIKEDPDEDSIGTESATARSYNDEDNNKEEEEEEEEEENIEEDIEEDEAEEQESNKASQIEPNKNNNNNNNNVKEEENNNNNDNDIVVDNNENVNNNINNNNNENLVFDLNVSNETKNIEDALKSDNVDDKMNQNDQNHTVHNVKKRSKLIIKTTCFLIDQFFENPCNSFLHNVVIDLIRTFFRFTRLAPIIFNRSKLLHRIIDIYEKEKSINLPFSGHIHKLVEIAQKLNFRMSKCIVKKKRQKPKEFQIFEKSEEWKNYLQNVFDYENEITKKNYGGFYSELYLVMKDTKERVLKPDL